MKKIDKELKKILQNHTIEMDEDTSRKIDILLVNLPEKEIKIAKKPKVTLAWKIVAAFMAVIILLPNLNPQIAMAMYEIPYVGEFFKVITVRNYQYQDEKHKAEIEIPQIIVEAGESDGIKTINKETEQLITRIIENFKTELDQEYYNSTYVTYDVLCDSETWFTLRLYVEEVSGSSNQYYKYYHIDKKSGEIVRLGDLFVNDAYIEAISENIKQQMIEQMQESTNETIVYWLESIDGTVDTCYKITETQNYYFNSNGEIVIVYDKYVVGPGSVGCPEFTIPVEVYETYLK